MYFYVPNTSTPKDTWQDQSMEVLNTNPVMLDAAGEAIIWGNGNYRQLVQDANGVVIWDRETVDPSYQLSSDLSASSGSSVVGFLQQGSGAASQTVQDGLYNRICLMDFIPPAEHAAIRAGTSIYDCSPAIEAALASNRITSGSNSGSAEIYIPYGTYNFSRSIQLKCAVILRGDGNGMAGGIATTLKFPDGVTGLYVNRYNTLGPNAESPATTGADGATLKGLYFLGAGQASSPATGIVLYARATLEDVRVGQFGGNGVSILGGGGFIAGVSTNANGWQANRVTIYNCGGDGFFTDGSDANAGCGISLDVSTCSGCGIRDSSFLGNTYLGCQTDTNGRNSQVSDGTNRYYCVDATRGGTVTPGADSTVWVLIGAGGVSGTYPLWESGHTYQLGYSYQTDDASAYGAFIACYVEGGQPPPRMASPNSIILGGGLATTGKAPGSSSGAFYSNTSTGVTGDHSMSYLGRDNSGNRMIVSLGGDANNGDLLRYTNPSDIVVWRIKRALATDNISWVCFNSQTASVLTGPNTTNTFGRSAPVPYRWLYPDMFIGSGNNARNITSASAAPTTGEHAKGDVVWNANPTAGGNAGWICTVGGTPGTWNTFGPISS